MTKSFALTIDAVIPSKLAAFWAAILEGYAIRPYSDGDIADLTTRGLTPETDPSVAVDGPGPTLWFQQVDTLPAARNRLHLDVFADDLEAEEKLFVSLGARIKDRRKNHIVFLDPEGNQFCLFPSG